MQFGTERKPAARNSFSAQPSNLEGTLSHQLEPPGPPEIIAMSLSRKDSSTAFFSHWFTCHSPPCFSATRALPESRSSRAATTASRTAPLVSRLTLSRASQACSMVL